MTIELSSLVCGVTPTIQLVHTALTKHAFGTYFAQAYACISMAVVIADQPVAETSASASFALSAAICAIAALFADTAAAVTATVAAAAARNR